MNWWNRKKLTGLLAQSLYEELDGDDRRALERGLDADPELRAEAEALSQFIDAIPREQPELERDLLPAVRARLADESPQPRYGGLRVAVAAVACVAALGLFGYGMWNTLTLDTDPGADGPVLASSVAPLLVEAETAVEQRNYTRAFEILDMAVAEYPRDASAGEAQYRLASLAFEQGRYPEAFEAYTKLKSEYHGVLDADPAREAEVAEARDLLEEANRVSYASLHALDVARRGRDLAQFEEILVDYAATKVAELAVYDMAKRASDGLDPADSSACVEAMKTARDRCSSPVAVAGINFELGNVYRDRVRDFELAGEHYRKAAEVPVLAQRANDALASLARPVSR